MSANNAEERFHETWLGMVQPYEGLTVSVPVLVDAQCMERKPPETQRLLLELCPPQGESELGPCDHTIAHLPQFLSELLDLTPDLWDATPDLWSATSGDTPAPGWAGRLSPDLAHYVSEGGQELRPTLGLRHRGAMSARGSQTGAAHAPRAELPHNPTSIRPTSGATSTSCAQAAEPYLLLLWQLPDGLDLDRSETETGPWEYAPGAKFERLLRAAEVPIGLLCNGRHLRLYYAPKSEATGHLTFRLDDMATVGGRPILDALCMLLSAQRFFGVGPEQALPAILENSRRYQANVTTELDEQVLEAMTLLLRGFEAAAIRDGQAPIWLDGQAAPAQHDRAKHASRKLDGGGSLAPLSPRTDRGGGRDGSMSPPSRRSVAPTASAAPPRPSRIPRLAPLQGVAVASLHPQADDVPVSEADVEHISDVVPAGSIRPPESEARTETQAEKEATYHSGNDNAGEPRLSPLQEALARPDNHLYRGLLTVLLRMVFVLFAEDRDLLPISHPFYQRNLSLFGLFSELQADHDTYPDSMNRRFSAWGRLVSLFRAIFLGAHHGDLHMPARAGALFDPNSYAFLEGWDPTGSAPIRQPEARSQVQLPTVDDETLFLVLERLIYFKGQRISYRSLGEEQIGSVYEGLMGYFVRRLEAPGVRMKPNRVWVTAEEVLEVDKNFRAKWLKTEVGLAKAQADKLAKAIGDVAEPKGAGQKAGKEKRRARQADGPEQGAHASPSSQRPPKPRGRARSAGTQPEQLQLTEEAVQNAPQAVADQVYALLLPFAVGRRAAEKAEATAPAGQLVLQPGSERRRTSSHYTPRTLTEPIVRRALEPLLACMATPNPIESNHPGQQSPQAGVPVHVLVHDQDRQPSRSLSAKGSRRRAQAQQPRSDGKAEDVHEHEHAQARRREESQGGVQGQIPSHRILNLKICDPAMGSGAFLVETCRQLAQHLHAAWQREGKHGKSEQLARRMIAQRCLYGVDKNEGAVELAKLALWLFTLDRDRPFTFLDHALRHGDSLVGLSFEQIRAFHWDLSKSKQLELPSQAVSEALQEAIDARLIIMGLALQENGVWPDPQEKYIALNDFDDAMDRVRLIADVCIGAFFEHDKDKLREQERKRRLALVESWLRATRPADELALEGELRAMQAHLWQTQAPFHWHIEFPDIFCDARPDPLDGDRMSGDAALDGLIGNPPFMGGGQLSGMFGDSYRDWLLQLHAHAHGNADLCAHFFRRTGLLLGTHGTASFVATNTALQGDTCSTGIQPLVREGAPIYDAHLDLPWGGGSAVTVSIFHIALGVARLFAAPSTLAANLNSQLKRTTPERLNINQECSYKGSMIYGQGFTLTPEERQALVDQHPDNARCTFPYLGGEEVNTSPTQSPHRHVINFGQMSLEEAEAFPDLLAIVREKVKPERDKNKREQRKKYWWRFGEATPALYAALAPLQRCLVTACVSKHLCFSFQPTGRVFSHKLYVFPLETYTAFAVLQSRIHEPWTRLHSSTLKTDLNYSASDCFDTFPFPACPKTSDKSPRVVLPALEKAGKALERARAEFMVERDIGLTKTYNLLKDPEVRDPEVLQLRELHEAMDLAVVQAYGWEAELCPQGEPPPYCPGSPAEEAELKRFQEGVIDRLYALNAERAAAEGVAGGKVGGKKKGRRKAAEADATAGTATRGKRKLASTRPKVGATKGRKKVAG